MPVASHGHLYFMQRFATIIIAQTVMVVFTNFIQHIYLTFCNTNFLLRLFYTL
ncbi:MAG: hypothetical protein RL172_1560 [Bacteroidota bacterium]|jgi:hypothetical protein